MLGLLSQIGPINGNSLSRSADVVIGDFWTLTRSQVYRELQTLEQLGYVHAGPVGARSSREFSITTSGVGALRRWLDGGPTSDVIRWPILLTIRFGAQIDPVRLRAILSDFASRHQAKREFYAELDAIMCTTRHDPFEIATVRFGQLFEDAVATWLDELPDLLPQVFSDEANPADAVSPD